MTLTIEVKQKHIDSGRRDCGWACPIALAMHDAGIFEPMVNDLELYLKDFDEWQIVPTPREAATFIRAFDSGAPVSPFTFTIETPEGK